MCVRGMWTASSRDTGEDSVNTYCLYVLHCYVCSLTPHLIILHVPVDIPNYVYYDSMSFCAPPCYRWRWCTWRRERRYLLGGGELGDDGDTSNIDKEEVAAGVNIYR